MRFWCGSGREKLIEMFGAYLSKPTATVTLIS
jgi:hypothetical protein